jgi:hypothetical protein
MISSRGVLSAAATVSYGKSVAVKRPGLLDNDAMPTKTMVDDDGDDD